MPELSFGLLIFLGDYKKQKNPSDRMITLSEGKGRKY
jgi:hypothetical protein